MIGVKRWVKKRISLGALADGDLQRFDTGRVLRSQQSVDIEALGNTGATYTSNPGNVLFRLGIGSRESQICELVDDIGVEYTVGYASIRLEERVK